MIDWRLVTLVLVMAVTAGFNAERGPLPGPGGPVPITRIRYLGGYALRAILVIGIFILMDGDQKLRQWRESLPLRPNSRLLVALIWLNTLTAAMYAGHINNLIAIAVALEFIPFGLGFIRGSDCVFGRQGITDFCHEVIIATIAAFLGTAAGYGVTNSLVLGLGVGIFAGIATGLVMIVGFAISFNLRLAGRLLSQNGSVA